MSKGNIKNQNQSIHTNLNKVQDSISITKSVLRTETEGTWSEYTDTGKIELLNTAKTRL